MSGISLLFFGVAILLICVFAFMLIVTITCDKNKLSMLIYTYIFCHGVYKSFIDILKTGVTNKIDFRDLLTNPQQLNNALTAGNQDGVYSFVILNDGSLSIVRGIGSDSIILLTPFYHYLCGYIVNYGVNDCDNYNGRFSLKKYLKN